MRATENWQREGSYKKREGGNQRKGAKSRKRGGYQDLPVSQGGGAGWF